MPKKKQVKKFNIIRQEPKRQTSTWAITLKKNPNKTGSPTKVDYAAESSLHC